MYTNKTIHFYFSSMMEPGSRPWMNSGSEIENGDESTVLDWN